MTNYQQSKWQFVAVIIFILHEMYIVYFIGTNASLFDFAVFYLFAMIFFYTIFFMGDRKFVSINISSPLRAILFCSIICLIACIISNFNALFPNQHEETAKTEKLDVIIVKSIDFNLYIFTLFIVCCCLAKLLSSRRNEKLKIAKIERQSELLARMENALLRSRMNPHLMFNALSSIQGVLMEKAPETLNLIYTLAEIQNTSLKLSNPAYRNSLGEEILATKHIIDLFSMLGKNNLNSTIDVEEKYAGLSFPGQVLVTIVENVFKHANFNDIDFPPLIQIKTSGHFLNVLVQNKISQKPKEASRKNYGMGHVVHELKSAFTDRYTLKIFTEQGCYRLELKIQL